MVSYDQHDRAIDTCGIIEKSGDQATLNKEQINLTANGEKLGSDLE